MAIDMSRPGGLDPSLSGTDLAQLAASDEARVRAAVAAHPNTPIPVIAKLAKDEAHSVRAGVARNPSKSVPEEVLRELANDNAPDVVFALIANEAVPDSVIARVMRGKHKDAIGPAKARLAKSGSRGGLLGALSR